MVDVTDWGTPVSGASQARVPGVPQYEGHASGTIDISFVSNGNDPVVTYAIKVIEDGVPIGYIQSDGSVDSDEFWQTLEEWGDIVTVIGLTDFKAYTFQVSAKNEMGDQTEWSDYSVEMNTLPDVDYGLDADDILREKTPANVKVEITGISGDIVPDKPEIEYLGIVNILFLLYSYTEALVPIEGEFSEDSGENWEAATMIGETEDLETSVTGTPHEIGWDSYTDAGKSEYKSTIRFRIRAQNGDGDWSYWAESVDFVVCNLPDRIVWGWQDGREWDKTPHPVAISVIPSLNGGDHGFPECIVFESDGTTEILRYESVISVVGWEYETEPDVWIPLTQYGIPESVIDGKNRMRFTIPDALENGEYIIRGRMGEVRDRG